MATVTNPGTAIRRFEKGEVRDVRGPIEDESGIVFFESHIKGQPGVRERKWFIQLGKILKCEINNPEDKERNERKIQKFITKWNET